MEARGRPSRTGAPRLIAMLLLAATAVAASVADARSDEAVGGVEAALRLWNRTGFGAPALAAGSVPEPERWDRVVSRWVDDAAKHRVAATPPPDWTREPLQIPFVPKDLDEAARKDSRRQLVRRTVELQAWWMQEMLSTPAPLAERMTLFWHGHFTSGVRGVRSPLLLYRQNLLLRRYALGNYRELLHAIARDGAMLFYLNNEQNRKGAPNENFARELLELFTLGEGHYSEQDIHEAARAFTGWKARPPDGEFFVAPRQHDDGDKTFLGRTGNLDGDEVIDRILAQPRAAEFVVGQLWREFVSPTPDAGEVRKLAADFRRDWELAPLLKALLREPAFRAAHNAGVLVKSPVEFVVGTARTLGLPLSGLNAALAADGMGQALFDPPNVAGWPGGDAWITSQSLLARRQFVLAIAGDAPSPAAPEAMNRTAMNAPPEAGDGEMDRGDPSPDPDRDPPMADTPAAKPRPDAGGGARRAARREMRRQAPELQRRFGEIGETLRPGDDSRLLALAPVAPPEDGAKPPDRLETWLLDPVYNLK